MRDATLERILAARAAREPLAVATRLGDGAQGTVTPNGADAEVPEAVAREARTLLARDRSATVGEGEGTWFVQAHAPPLRIAVVGAVHIAQPLVRMAAMVGFEAAVIDPRSAFATGARFPGVRIVDAWPDEALEAMAPDSRTAVVTLTHDPKLDDAALGAALRTPAFYIGSLGSAKTHGARLRRLRRAGFGDDDLDRIRGPVGLPIGARAPAEIALAVMAEVVAARRGAS